MNKKIIKKRTKKYNYFNDGGDTNSGETKKPDYDKIAGGVLAAAGGLESIINTSSDLTKVNSGDLESSLEAIGDTTFNGDNANLLSSYNSMTSAPIIDDKAVGGLSFGKHLKGFTDATLSGASAGMQVGGPWGALAGGIAGSLGAGIGSIIGKSKREKEMERMSRLKTEMLQRRDSKFNLAVENNQNNLKASQLKNYAAEGGFLNNFDNNENISYFENGGTHEENPYGGIPLGKDNKGTPNLVEEGEVKFNDYVFSNRLKVPISLLNKYKLPKGKANKTFAEVFKNLNKEYEERPNDPISKQGLENSALKLQQAQEEFKAMNNKKLNKNIFAWGGETLDYTYPNQYGNRTPILTKDDMMNHPIFSQPIPLPTKLDNLEPTAIPVMPKRVEPIITKNGASPRRHNFNSIESYLRYAPVVASGIASLTDALGATNKPDYRNADMIGKAVNAIPDAKFNPIGNYMSYNPLDINYHSNKLNAQAAATRSAINNQAGGNRATAMANLLASDYNAQNALGSLARQAEEYNLENRMRVEDFNRGTNQFNAQAGLQAQGMNQNAAAQRLAGRTNQANMREAILNASNAAKMANLQTFIDNLGSVGIDATERDRFNTYMRNSGTTLTDEEYLSMGARNARNMGISEARFKKLFPNAKYKK